MSEIRPFTHADIPAVANLFMRVFRGSKAPAPESVRQCFEELYFNNPWNDGSIESFVNQTSNGEVSGFIGAMPRTMAFQNREITVVVAGNHMVDQENRELFVGSNLLKRLLGGPQDLTFTDSANDISRRLWEKLGAVTLLNYSLRWLRILRPVSYPLSLIGRYSGAPVLRTLFVPAAAVGDRLGRIFLSPPDTAAAKRLTAKSLTPELIVSGLTTMAGSSPLRPHYDAGKLTWLLTQAQTKEQYGGLNARALDHMETLAGWYLYYGRRGETAEVLQLAARPDTFAGVMNHLFVDAYEQGSPAVMGVVDPRYLREIHAHKCIILLRPMYTTAHARNAELLKPLLLGQAFLSRLEGEWWTRLQGDSFH
ncbi:MAG TPA: GNAT family N-acetyltransferase [Bacteroidota bacterium]|nr:GNAT family N-acetyltransferase [Bacteroidota bacterium]